jgi:arginase
MTEPAGYRAGVRLIRVPYHLDEYLPDLDFPLSAGETVTAEPSSGDLWGSLALLGGAVAEAVAVAAMGAAVGGATGSGLPIVLSGDCTTSLGTVAGLQHAGIEPGIVWFDAHGDVQTPETTASGYLGGMPLRLLTGYRPELIAGRLGLAPVPEWRITLAGARDLDPPEVAYLAGAGIHRSEVVSLAAADLPAGPLYVHVDMDVIDSAQVPGLRYPAPRGPSPAQLAGALHMIIATGRVAALGLACTWYPGHCAAERVRPAVEAALASLGPPAPRCLSGHHFHPRQNGCRCR